MISLSRIYSAYCSCFTASLSFTRSSRASGATRRGSSGNLRTPPCKHVRAPAHKDSTHARHAALLCSAPRRADPLPIRCRYRLCPCYTLAATVSAAAVQRLPRGLNLHTPTPRIAPCRARSIPACALHVLAGGGACRSNKYSAPTPLYSIPPRRRRWSTKIVAAAGFFKLIGLLIWMG